MLDPLAQRDVAHVIHPLTRHRQLDEIGPVIVVEGAGATVTLDDGRVLIDGSAGLWNVNVGHGRTELAEAAKAQMEKLAFSPTFGGFSHEPAIELAERLSEISPGDLSAAMFTSGGSEANETAFKLARYYWRLNGKPEKLLVLSHDRGYHGLSLAAGSSTRLDQYHGDFGPNAPGFDRIPAPYPDRCSAGIPCDPDDCDVISGRALARRIEELGADNVAAVIAEPVLGTGGVIVPPLGYLANIRKVCDQYDVLLIADEVITGFGRTGRMFGVEHEGVVPDLMTFAKGVTSGYMPLGGVLVREHIRQALHSVPDDHPLMHGFTYCGHPVACVVALKNIDIVEREQLVAQAEARGNYLAKRLQDLAALPEVGDIRSRGLMAGIELVANQETRERFPAELGRGGTVSREARSHGLATRPLLDDILLLAPPLVISEEEIDRCVEAMAISIEATRP
jgi:adenosylmethionine-8-amino-7-oxononanoate aminotransferase